MTRIELQSFDGPSIRYDIFDRLINEISGNIQSFVVPDLVSVIYFNIFGNVNNFLRFSSL